MALFRSEGAGRELPSFVTIITELSKHDLGELVGEEGGNDGRGKRGSRRRSREIARPIVEEEEANMMPGSGQERSC